MLVHVYYTLAILQGMLSLHYLEIGESTKSDRLAVLMMVWLVLGLVGELVNRHVK